MRAFTVSFLLVAGAASAQPYFQQQVDYVIDVRLDDQAHILPDLSN